MGIAVFAGVRLATADPGGPTRPSLTFAGVLRNTDGSAITTARSASLTFSFTKPGAPVCTSPAVATMIAAGGAFSVLVSIESCGSSFFDGSNITYTVSDGADVLTPTPQAITPVPYARFADQAGVSNDCPAGYTRDTMDPNLTATMRLCVRTVAGGRDEMMRVGTGASGFWVDRHEASVWTTDGTNIQVGGGSADYANLAASGTWIPVTATSAPYVAVSRSGVRPSRFITWFQANEVCHAAGKMLMSREQWFVAAQGTGDPGANDGSGGLCNTDSGGVRNTGLGANGCRSVWGAQDMIGNLSEWTAEWYAGVGQVTSTSADPPTDVRGRLVNAGRDAWPTGFSGDGTSNVTSVVFGSGPDQIGLPSAPTRGGSWGDGVRAGVFRLDLTTAPSARNDGTGFRCVVTR